MYESKSKLRKRNKPALSGKSNAHTVNRFSTSVAEVKKKKKKPTMYAASPLGPLSKRES
jgi:hypothetical protein